MFLIVSDIPLYNLCHLYYNNKDLQKFSATEYFQVSFFLYLPYSWFQGIMCKEGKCDTINNTMVRIFSHSFISYVNIDIILRQDTRSGRLIC